MGKKEIRAEVKKRRAEAELGTLHENSKKIVETFVNLSQYQNMDLLLAYVDAKREVETRLLMERAWKDHKKVAAPRVDGDGIMDYYYINSLDDLDPGSFGIMEPKMDCPICEDENGLMLMPGVAFDEHCHRVGYGGGYYDRYLEKHPDIVHIALAFEFQVFPEVPFEAHDILPQMLVTEKRIIRPEETSERTLEEIGRRAKAAEPVLRIMGTTKKNEVLLHVADALIKEQNYILGKNAKDVEIAKKNGMEPGMVDRLIRWER